MTGKIALHTISLGCPKNLVDTERMLGILGESFSPVDSMEQSEVVLINTCGFIQSAVEESVQTILEVSRDIKELPRRPVLAVTGCLLARYGQELRTQLPEVDLWIPLQEQEKVGSYLAWALKMGDDLTDSAGEGTGGMAQRRISTGPSYAYLKISEGCNRSCSFCLIPRIRGSLRSRPIGSLKEEARSLVAQGVREIVLVGQDITEYGRDLDGEQDLVALLRELASLPGLAWLRPMYLYPAGITDNLLVGFRELSPPVLPYFDIPLQHAHADILRKMGRPFSTQPYKVVDKVRSFFPEASLRTTLLTGFPGEEESHFQVLAEFVRQVRFQHMGVFSFFPEEGVRAARYSGQVPQGIKEARKQELMRIQAEISGQIHSEMEGKTMSVLVDRSNPEWPTLYEGRAWFQAPEVDGICYVSGESLSAGDMVQARIEEAKTYDLIGLA